MTDSVRTPDARFERLPDFGWSPHYLEGQSGLRMAYLDEGPADAAHTFLCLHGEPSWSFLYRKMIPVFLDSGARVLAPDFYGFGRSDKPTDDAVYTWDFHRGSLVHFIKALDLTRITLVCQDWGGLLGLTLPVDHPDLIARLIVMNTALAVGVAPGPGFAAWKDFVASQADFDVGGLMSRAIDGLGDEERAAYDAPFVDASYKAGVRSFPQIVPISPDMPGAAMSKEAARWWKTEWSGPSFMGIGMQDPVLGPPVMKQLRETIRGCPEPMAIAEAGHFVQEHGEAFARAAVEAFKR